jgi:acetylornithine deacetylase/succinyl-diaminopimelate desuccinylase-like protein
VISDDSIKIDILLSRVAAPSPTSPDALKAIAEYGQAKDPGTPMMFPMGSGFTDCHFFRAKGIPCLGFLPRRGRPSEEAMVHGINERVSVEGVKSDVRAMYEIVHKLAAE